MGGAVGEAGAADPLRTARYWALAPLAWAPVAVCFGAFVAYGALSQLACASVAGSSLAAADAHFRAPPECRPSPVLGEGDEKEAPTDVPAAADLPLHVANAFLYDGEGGEAEEESLWMVTVAGATAARGPLSSGPKPEPRYYKCLYTKRSNKKHKSYQDGVLTCVGRTCTLQNFEDGKQLSKANHVKGAREDMLADDSYFLDVGSWEVEVGEGISEEDYLAGRCFAGGMKAGVAPLPAPALAQRPQNRAFQAPDKGDGAQRPQNRSFQAPGKGDGAGKEKAKARPALKAKFDQSAKDAVLLNNGEALKSGRVAAVCVDPALGRHLRPHQVEGVQFMYNAVSGRVSNVTGCVLADSMGLGKTFQSIALLWTLLEQSSQGVRRKQGGKTGGEGSVDRVLIVCPSSLVSNWQAEIQKWLGQKGGSDLCVAVSGGAARTNGFGSYNKQGKNAKEGIIDWAGSTQENFRVLCISYELMARHADLIAKGKPGLLICDEAHRLKNTAGTKTQRALEKLGCERRVLLTGTPVQNNLLELFALLNFASPNSLGDLATFRRVYATPIQLSRDRGASDRDRAIGAARAKELQTRIRHLCLRRGPEVLAKFLPPKKELVLFCSLTPSQKELYRRYLRTKWARTGENALTAILHLRMLATSPGAVQKALGVGGGAADGEMAIQHAAAEELTDAFAEAEAAGAEDFEGSKAAVLVAMVKEAHERGERTVVVSNFQVVLDRASSWLGAAGLGFLRLDGSTKQEDRQGLVDRFNRRVTAAGGASTWADRSLAVFLLSAKAGGVGLNLIGGNHLVLLDIDWNPATDFQAMGRVWRDGQRLPVTVVRLVSSMTVDEKILQRQVLKNEFRDAVADADDASGGTGSTRHFAKDEIKDLFNIKPPIGERAPGAGRAVCDTVAILKKAHPQSKIWQDVGPVIAAEDPCIAAAYATGLVACSIESGVGKGVTDPESARGAAGDGAAGDGAAGVGSDGAPGEAPASPLLPAEVSGDASGATRASGGAAAVADSDMDDDNFEAECHGTAAKPAVKRRRLRKRIADISHEDEGGGGSSDDGLDLED